MAAAVMCGAVWAAPASAGTITNKTAHDIVVDQGDLILYGLPFVLGPGESGSYETEGRLVVAANPLTTCNVDVDAGGVVEVESLRQPFDTTAKVMRCSGYRPAFPARELVDRDPYISGDEPDERSVRFLATADPQFWFTDPFPEDVRRRNGQAEDTLNVMNDWLRQDFRALRGALVAGDLTQNSRLDEWMYYRATIENPINARGATRDGSNPIWLKSPVGTINRLWYDTIGNHDRETRLNSTEPASNNEVRCDLGRSDCQDPDAIAMETTLRYRTAATIFGGPARYAWDWHDVRFISAGLYPDEGAQNFIYSDLRANVGTSGRPVVIMHHYGFDSLGDGWWGDTVEEGERLRRELWHLLEPYNVVAFITGHRHSRPDDPWRFRFNNPGNDASAPKATVSGDHAPPCDTTERTADGERACIPTYVVGAAMFDPPSDDQTSPQFHRGAFVEVSISGTDCGPTVSNLKVLRPAFGQDCLVVRRYRAEDYNDGDATDVDAVERASDLQLIDVPTPPDTVAPVAQPEVSAPSDAGWHRAVTVEWNWTDDRHGFDAAGDNCPQTSTFTTQGHAVDGATFSATCTDRSGNKASADLAGRSFKIDTVAPSASVSPVPGGWFTSAVTATFTWSDSLSGVDPGACTTTDTTEGEGKKRPARATCRDRAGNVEFGSASYDVDSLKPVVRFFRGVTPRPNPAGWHTGDVSASWSWEDPGYPETGSGLPATCDSSVTTTGEEGDPVKLVKRCTDVAGNEQSASVEVKIDRTKPAISLRERPAPNANGWFSSPVTIRWDCKDELSKPVQAVVEDVVEDEGEGLTAKGTCLDVAGNASSAEETGIHVDGTPPAIELEAPVDGATYDLEEDVAASYRCADQEGLSGVDTCAGTASAGSPVDTTEAGTHEFTVTAKDKAGNGATKTVTYTVRQAPTRLDTAAAVLTIKPGLVGVTVGRVSARLTYGSAGKPAAGRRVTFTTGASTLCSALTGADGVAACDFTLAPHLLGIVESGVTARFDGDANLLPSTDEESAVFLYGLRL